MKPHHFLRVKGMALIPVGLLLLIAPEWAIDVLGGEAGPVGVLFARLCGLSLLGMGREMLGVGVNEGPTVGVAVNYAVWDVVAALLLTGAVLNQAFGALAYVLAGTYGASAFGFTFCAFYAYGKYSASAGQ